MWHLQLMTKCVNLIVCQSHSLSLYTILPHLFMLQLLATFFKYLVICPHPIHICMSFVHQKLCSDLTSYVQEVLGPYAVNVTMATRLCSMSLCKGLGRCVRKKAEDPVYLHLPPAHFLLLRRGAEGIRATGQLPQYYLDGWRRDFHCHWFEALEGAAADQESVGIESGGQRSLPTIKPNNIAIHTVGTYGQSEGIEKTFGQSEETVAPMTPAEQEPSKSGCPAHFVTIILLCVPTFFSFTNFNF